MRFEEDLLQFQQQFLAHKKHQNDKLQKLEYLVALISQGKIREAIRKNVNENPFEKIPGSAFQHRGIFRDPTHAEQERRKMSINKMYEEEVTECKCSNEVQQQQISELERKRSKVNLRPKLEDVYDADGGKINSANVLGDGCYMCEGQPLLSNYMLDCDKVMDDKLRYEEPPIFDEEPPATLPPKIAEENCAEIPGMDKGAASFSYRSQQGGHELILWPKFVVEEREKFGETDSDSRTNRVGNLNQPKSVESEIIKSEHERQRIYTQLYSEYLVEMSEISNQETFETLAPVTLHEDLKQALCMEIYGESVTRQEEEWQPDAAHCRNLKLSFPLFNEGDEPKHKKVHVAEEGKMQLSKYQDPSEGSTNKVFVVTTHAIEGRSSAHVEKEEDKMSLKARGSFQGGFKTCYSNSNLATSSVKPDDTDMTYCSNVTSYDRYSESSEYVELPRFDAEPEDQVVKPEECEDKTWPFGVLDLEENGRTKDTQKHQESQCQPCEFDMLREIFSCEEYQCNADVIAELCMEKKEQSLPTGILGEHDSICDTCPIYGEDSKEAVGPLKTELILNALGTFIPEEHEGLMLEASQVFQKGNEHLNTLVEMDLLKKEEASNLILLNLLSSSCCNLRAIVAVTGGSIYNNLFEFEDIEVLSFQITIFDPGGFKTEHP